MLKKSKGIKIALIVGVLLVVFYGGLKPFGADLKDVYNKLVPDTTTEQPAE